MARPSKFLPAARLTIVQAMRDGISTRAAAALAGLNPCTLHEWLGRGEAEADDPTSEFAQFARNVAQARAEAEREAVQEIRKAGKDSWQAYAWWLERTYPDVYARADWRNPPKDPTAGDFAVDLTPDPAGKGPSTDEPSPDADAQTEPVD